MFLQQLARGNSTFSVFLAQTRLARGNFYKDGAARAEFETLNTIIASSDCVDGRVPHPQKVLGLPYGCVHHFRMPGGVFNFADEFAALMFDLNTQANAQGKHLLLTPGLHRSDDERDGCAWMRNDFGQGVSMALQLSEDCTAAFGQKYFNMVLRCYNTTTGCVDCFMPQTGTWIPMHTLDVREDNLQNLPIRGPEFLAPLDLLVRGMNRWRSTSPSLPQTHGETGFIFTDATFCLPDRQRLFLVNPYLVDRTRVLDGLGTMVIKQAEARNEQPLIVVLLSYDHGDKRARQSKVVEARAIARELGMAAYKRSWDPVIVYGVKSSKYYIELGVPDSSTLELVSDEVFRLTGEYARPPQTPLTLHGADTSQQPAI